MDNFSALESNNRSTEALDLAAVLAAALGKSNVMPLRPQDEVLLEATTSFRFGPDRSRLAWSVGEGPLVVLVHGYSGRGVQMAALAHKIAGLGFRSVFFDAGGHGASRAEKVGFHTFINDTRDLVLHLNEPIHALVGHSAGALAMMRARALHAIGADRYVVISAPLFPYVPLDTMRQRGATEEALDHIKAVLCDQFESSWSALTRGDAFTSEAGKPLLAIYDKSDDRVRHTDADRLATLWPDATILKTDGFGHNRILQAPETLDATAEFVSR